MKFEDLPKEQQEKALGDVFCLACQKSFRLETYRTREFRGALFIEGQCPTCGGDVVKPVGTK